MKIDSKQTVRAAAVMAALPLIMAHTAAGQTTSTEPPPAESDKTADMRGGADDNRLHMGFSVDYSYVAGSDATVQNLKGNSDAQAVSASVTAEIPVNDKWFVPFRITSHDFFLGTVAGMPIPDQINTIGFDAGVGYHFNEQWTFAASVGPRLYRYDDINSDDVGAGGMLIATYKWTPNLTVAMGLNFETDREVPVLPAGGLQWKIRPDLTLDLMWPRTALIYKANRNLDLFVGVGGNFTVFRADPNAGNNIGQPAFNNALATYRDFHVGVGAEYRFLHGLSLEVQGGYSVGRHIDYSDLDQTVKFDASPYVQTGLRWRF